MLNIVLYERKFRRIPEISEGPVWQQGQDFI